MQDKINHIINEYKEFNKLFTEHEYDLDNYDEQYKIWLKGMSEELIEELQADLNGLCEDNEVMKEAIKEYFENL